MQSTMVPHTNPLAKYTKTSPLINLSQVNLPKSPNAASVSIFMQLISAPESNKHENTNPPVSILKVVPLAVPLSMVNT